MTSDKTYVLGMFPYPSGEGLHVGHVRIYTAVDVMARYFRMKSREAPTLRLADARSGSTKESQILSPTGWDAFGLPAENAAIKAKKNPAEMVPKNEANFQRQMQDLQLTFDWDRVFSTSDPDYYGITQWIFLQLYKIKNAKGERLIYRKVVPINWCPFCKTGLANEEVLPDGTHERCGNPVEKRDMPQWVMRITDYADRLLTDLDRPLSEFGGRPLDWPKGILEMQRHWIGKKGGARVSFEIVDGRTSITDRKIEVFTTRLDTIFGVTFLVVAPELVRQWMDSGWEASEEVRSYVERSLQKTEQMRLAEAGTKSGVPTGLKAVNPANGEEVPIYVADYVLSDVGTGAVMGVPAHDSRDWEFAKKHNLPTVEVVRTEGAVRDGATEADGILINSGKYSGLKSEEAREKILKDLSSQGKAREDVTYHLRDWVFSRQRYWGEPIPLVYCEKCGDENGVVPVPEDQLPLKLPYLKSYEPTGTGESPLARVGEWVNTTCPICDGPAKRETDTMPNWAGSCWYFLAFPWWKEAGGKARTLNNEIVQEKMRQWLPVDWYLGGAEHAVLHLLYARFWVKALYDLKILSFTEPFLRLRSVGMVLAEDGRKMSKSWGNVISPDDMVAKYGADAVRLYEMFMGPWDQAISWDTRTLVGQVRFLGKVKEVFEDPRKFTTVSSPALLGQLARLVKQVEQGIVEQKFNTSIAGMMEFVNSWRQEEQVLSKTEAKVFVQLLAPFAPLTAENLWQQLEGKGSVHEQAWPTVTESVPANVETTIVIQVNGKVRGTVRVPHAEAASQEQVEKAGLADERVRKWLDGKEYASFFVPGRLINFVTK